MHGGLMHGVSNARGRRWVMALCTSLVAVAAVHTQQRPAPDPNRWEPAIQKVEEADKLAPPAKDGIVFVGASSIVRWNLEESFPDLKGIAINRGFGGSEMADAARYANRVVVPYAPKVVVLYPRENGGRRVHPVRSDRPHRPSLGAHRRHWPEAHTGPLAVHRGDARRQ